MEREQPAAISVVQTRQDLALRMVSDIETDDEELPTGVVILPPDEVLKRGLKLLHWTE